MSEDGFLRAIHDNPKDDASRLVYADWLDEQGDAVSAAKADFLRGAVELATSKKPKGWKKAKRKRLQELAAALDTDWLAVVSSLAVENCGGERPRSAEFRFDFVCDRRWEDMRPTQKGDGVRFCDACRKKVHYCATITEGREHAESGHCIAVDLGVIRSAGDLTPLLMLTVGRPSVPQSSRTPERMWTPPDPVSAERERRKREGDGG
jgi:uncharacterized protein (TIGR02996 family)